ncbi:proline-specific peptidase [Punctularia strigosozonata HHB-11173 SS5]|uniref:Proline-specific peptidase n=1 Tax=Punctularia strigosozonata (strain HHB-11173) TaxID=741275 RepID=R7S449_PUNST|nr:proline-specific peptidase [Punctularia strigosozonata HHB-11173 SS5]EIN04993.1 proline-specific peptidase [Punctularia strigosozonata HHB-11173 SS5]
MASPSFVEGWVNFNPAGAGKPCQTWYKMYGDVTTAVHRPLIVIHDGPGAVHQYLLPVSELSITHSMPVIFYDQIGNGNSTHLPELKDDKSFWTESLFLDELRNLIIEIGIQDDYAILGHSWGGMLGARHAIGRPEGLKRLIIANSPTSMKLWQQSVSELRSGLPQELQDTLRIHEEDDTTDSEEYQAAVAEYHRRHVCRLDPMPKELGSTFAELGNDPTVCATMRGTAQFYITGVLKDYSVEEGLANIAAPTLLINGKYDEAQDFTIQPFFTSIPSVSWTQFVNSSHTPHLEEHERYLRVIAAFLS